MGGVAAGPALVLSCEHAGRRVPARWRPVFEGADDVLSSHRGWDPGAYVLARRLARSLAAPLVATTVTRLLVDTNRSEGHPRLFSTWTRTLPASEKATILARHHRPHRAAVAQEVVRGIAAAGSVLHLGVHTFTPVLTDRRRTVDIGVLYDPSRRPERELARKLLEELRRRLPGLRVRANEPYRGVSDGLTTTLRARFAAERYSGLELEVGQNLTSPRGRPDAHLVRAVEDALAELLRPTAPTARSTFSRAAVGVIFSASGEAVPRRSEKGP